MRYRYANLYFFPLQISFAFIEYLIELHEFNIPSLSNNLEKDTRRKMRYVIWKIFKWRYFLMKQAVYNPFLSGVIA